MAGDWIKVYRKMLKSELFNCPELFHAAMWCLLKAAHKPRTVIASTGRGSVVVQINPGQMVFGRKSAGRQLGCSEASAKRRINRLARIGFLIAHPSAHYSIVTICNWESYQQSKPSTDRPSSDHSVQACEQVSVQATVHIQEDKNIQEGKNSSRPKLRFDPVDRELAEHIWTCVYRLQPTRKPPDLDRWANDVRLMREADSRPPPMIREVFDWANRDSFWQTNILSPSKLRDKFDDLHLKINREPNGTSRQPTAGQLFDKDAGATDPGVGTF